MAEHVTVTPSGFEIRFEDGEPHPETGRSKRRQYLVDGGKLPSVTGVLGMLDKPGLVYWAEGLAVAGCIELARHGGLPLSADAALGRLTREGLRHFQVAQRKADRGKLSHDDLVRVAASRRLPPLAAYPEEQQGFIRGVAAFLSDLRPRIADSELCVASPKHGYAGRLDLRGALGVARLPDGSPAPPGVGLIDLKTHDRLPRTQPSKSHPRGQLKTPYPEHLLQVGLYEVAARESGYGETGWQAVVRVDASGGYDFTVSWIDPEETLAMLPAYRLFNRAASRVKGQADQRPVGVQPQLAGSAA